MNWQAFRNDLVNDPSHHERPQHTALIDRSFALVREGLQQLASLGHQFHLAEGPAPEKPRWPRMVYSLDHPRGFFCLCQQDFEFLGEGWYDTLDEVKLAAAIKEQYKGRGGELPKSGLPATIVDDSQLTYLDRQRKAGLE